MRPEIAQGKTIPIDMVGSSTFGRYPKISLSQTYNMIISDDWMVPYAGFELATAISLLGAGFGRGLFSSQKLNKMYAVVNNYLYSIDTFLSVTQIGKLDSSTGDVFMDENEKGEIAVCDQLDIWIYSSTANTFVKATTDFTPGYVIYHDGRFIAPDTKSNQWRLSSESDSTSWPDDASHAGLLQSKPDIAKAVIRVPGKMNLVHVMGQTVSEPWIDTGTQLFPYQRNSYFNIDYGLLNPASVATSDQFVVWFGSNEKSGPVILMSDGGPPQQISTDGINFRLANLKNPTNVYAFMFKQDGHLIYQITWPDPEDDITLAYDFNTKKFFNITNEHMGCHIARHLVYFNNEYFFISFNDGNLYRMSSNIYTYNGEEIPRIRICSSLRNEDASRLILNNINVTLEQGQFTDAAAIDLTVSIDGGQTFSNAYRLDLNDFGHRQNRLSYWLGLMSNDIIPQFRFWGFNRFVIGTATAGVYQ